MFEKEDECQLTLVTSDEGIIDICSFDKDLLNLRSSR